MSRTLSHHFGLLRITRQNALGLIGNLSLEQLNRIPEGYNNNLLWNAAHMIVTQQLLMYSLSGLTPRVHNDFIESHRKGSRPQGNATAADLDYVKAQLLSTVDDALRDYQEGRFQQYTPYETSYGATLESIEEAIIFNNIHEGLHLGYMMALRKLV